MAFFIKCLWIQTMECQDGTSKKSDSCSKVTISRLYELSPHYHAWHAPERIIRFPNCLALMHFRRSSKTRSPINPWNSQTRGPTVAEDEEATRAQKKELDLETLTIGGSALNLKREGRSSVPMTLKA